jgi:predicted aspartyl protease
MSTVRSVFLASAMLLPTSIAISLSGCTAGDSLSFGRVESVSSDDVRVPLLSRALPIIRGTLDSGKSALLLLDTGSTSSVLSSREAARLDIPVRDHAPIESHTQNDAFSIRRIGRIDRLRLGGLPVTGVDAAILDTPIDGVGLLGIALFEDVPLLFDPEAREIRFIQASDVGDYLSKSYPGRTWSTLELSVENNYPLIKATLHGKPMRLALDTGSFNTNLCTSAAHRIGLTECGRESFVEYDITGAHPREAALFRKVDLRLGRWECALTFTAAAEGELRSSRIDGTLGYDVLGEVTFLVDLDGDRLLVLDPADGADSRLPGTRDSARRSFVRDPLPAVRLFAASSIAREGDRQLASYAAIMLEDEDSEVRNAAASALSSLSGLEWPANTRVSDAKAWWSLHEGDAEFQPLHDPGE